VKTKHKRPSTKLTPNQAAILAALAEGLSVPQIADEWEVSQTVVYRNIEGARTKLGAKTIPHATAIWIRMEMAGFRSANGHHVVATNGTSPHE